MCLWWLLYSGMLIPRRREIPLGYLVFSRSPDPSDMVEFDCGVVEDRELAVYDVDVIVGGGDVRLEIIANLAGGDEDIFIWLCRYHRIIPCWWGFVRPLFEFSVDGRVLRFIFSR